MSTAIQTLNPLPGRKAVILLTDGMDTASVATPEEALGSIGFGGLSISTIGFGEMSEEGEEQADQYLGIDEATLRSIAENAGGYYGYADDRAELSDIYDRLRRSLQSEVVISYETPIALRDGVARALTVRLADRFSIGGESQTSFNPGGLVPEVAQPASWLVFGFILAALLVLLFIPIIINVFSSNKAKPGSVKKKKSKVKITLKD